MSDLRTEVTEAIKEVVGTGFFWRETLVDAVLDVVVDDEDLIHVFGRYRDNSELIVACRDLGYLRDEWRTYDPTYGYGTFWKLWEPKVLVGTDLNPERSPGGESWDFRDVPLHDRAFDAVVFDPPYKLNGTPTAEVDERYGVDVYTRWQDKMQLCRDGIVELARLADKMLLIKCQDQVCSGKKRWQTREFADLAEEQGFRLRDMLHIEGGREQSRRCKDCPGEDCALCGGSGKIPVPQKHARQNFSTMLVLERT